LEVLARTQGRNDTSVILHGYTMSFYVSEILCPRLRNEVKPASICQKKQSIISGSGRRSSEIVQSGDDSATCLATSKPPHSGFTNSKSASIHFIRLVTRFERSGVPFKPINQKSLMSPAADRTQQMHRPFFRSQFSPDFCYTDSPFSRCQLQAQPPDLETPIPFHDPRTRHSPEDPSNLELQPP
jgi:hypothetical protein